MSCLEVMRAKGLKLTPQRRLIIDIIHDAHTHLTGEDIIKYVKIRMPGVNKSTIYRTLDILEQAGCVFKSESDDHFIYHHAEDGHHHHMICGKCGKTIECDEDVFRPIESSLLEKYGFSVDFKHVVMSGICEECKNKDS